MPAKLLDLGFWRGTIVPAMARLFGRGRGLPNNASGCFSDFAGGNTFGCDSSETAGSARNGQTGLDLEETGCSLGDILISEN